MRKLFTHDTLRHRLEDLPDFSLDSLPFVQREEKSRSLLFLAAGALAGLAAGYFVSQKLGGIGGITDRFRGKKGFRGTSLRGGPAHGTYDEDEEPFTDEELQEFQAAGLSPNEELEEHVLEAFYNDPILCERAVDIGALEDGIIELTGWVNTPDEATHAVTVANGVPGVETVVNRLTIRLEETQRDYQSVMYQQGDASLAEGHWEGQQVGIGRKRQGNSSEYGRDFDPKPNLEDKWMNKKHAIRDAAEDVDTIGSGNRKDTLAAGKTNQTGGRTDGSPVAPTGVPKSDHVAEPESSPRA